MPKRKKTKSKAKKKSSIKPKLKKKTKAKKKSSVKSKIKKKVLKKKVKIQKEKELVFKTRPEWVKSALINKTKYQKKYSDSIDFSKVSIIVKGLLIK